MDIFGGSGGLSLQPYQFSVSRLGGGASDSANIKAAHTSAINYALNNQGYAEVLLPDATGKYLANDPPTIGGSFNGNALIPLQPQAVGSIKPVIRLRGAGSGGLGDSLPHWQQNVPQQSGTIIATTRTDGTNDATYGPAFVIGGPWNGYGGGTSLFSNMCYVVDGITIQTPFNGTYGGFGFKGLGQARVIAGSYMPFAVVPAGQSAPQFVVANITNQWTYGLQMPDFNNNDLCDVLFWTAYGATYGFMPSEHTTAFSVRCNYNIIGIQAYATAGTPHGAHIHYASCEANTQAVGVLSTGSSVKIDIDQLDWEGGTNVLYDPNNLYNGKLCVRNGGTGYAVIPVNGGSAARILNLDQPPGHVAGQAVPATGVAFPNLYYVDATAQITGGTVSQIAIDGTNTGLTSGFFRVPTGKSITLTYTVAPTWNWWLDSI